MIKQAGVLIKGIKAILNETDYSTANVISTAQEVSKSSFPMIVFNFGMLDTKQDQGIQPPKFYDDDGTATISHKFIYNSELQIYSTDSLQCAEIGELIMLGFSSQQFLSTIEIESKTAHIQAPGVAGFISLERMDDIQVDERWLHRSSLGINWSFVNKLVVPLPCITDATKPVFTVEKESQ